MPSVVVGRCSVNVALPGDGTASWVLEASVCLPATWWRRSELIHLERRLAELVARKTYTYIERSAGRSAKGCVVLAMTKPRLLALMFLAVGCTDDTGEPDLGFQVEPIQENGRSY